MALQLRSTIKKEGTLELTLADVEVPPPEADEVVVRVEASPINPSDLGLLFGMADMRTAEESGTAERPVVTASVPPGLLGNMTARLDQSMPVGNEGAGVVIDAGSSDESQALLGKTVAILGGAMYAQFRCIKAHPTRTWSAIPAISLPRAGRWKRSTPASAGSRRHWSRSAARCWSPPITATSR